MWAGFPAPYRPISPRSEWNRSRWNQPGSAPAHTRMPHRHTVGSHTEGCPEKENGIGRGGVISCVGPPPNYLLPERGAGAGAPVNVPFREVNGTAEPGARAFSSVTSSPFRGFLPFSTGFHRFPPVSTGFHRFPPFSTDYREMPHGGYHRQHRQHVALLITSYQRGSQGQGRPSTSSSVK